MKKLLRRLADALFPARRALIEQLRRERDQARGATAKWRSKAKASSAKIGKLVSAVEDRERLLHSCKDAFDMRRRSTLTPAVLKSLLPSRASHRSRLHHDAAAATEREQRLIAVSPAYRQAAERAGAPPEGLAHTTVEGLAWWVPYDPNMPKRVVRAARQGLPLRAILQTREVAIGGVMIDLGANIGRTSIPRALLGDARAVWAAEPDPGNYACLVRNVVEHRLQGIVLPDQVAIGATRGEARLKRSKYIGGHRVVGATDRTRRARLASSTEIVSVPCWPLDEWMVHVGVAPEEVTFVKVDTQGSEVAVLRGASSLLGRAHVSWLLELDPALLRAAGATVPDLLALLEQHFTHFIDIGNTAPGARVQPTERLRDAVAYVGVRQTKTDLLVYRTAGS